ncbi:DUF3574 domain-containing protein [Bacillus sp. AFS018417]|uniref:DUF3574 domain-containing protein n=1 Tax=unclassified Bacillus (in: firmicutes) TaxID=185979 RepID=UPI000BF24DE3|nr:MULTISPECIES: DUF3574 domain-containing protein [unclassified Bacillus (in: firmicutes)]MCP1124242.1 DUF3574 domain-containing protein [Bacillus sp. 3103sda1]PEZ00459.1 DUF3574 domain-containing protein [Bacillus sp. AFS018417]
MKRKKILYWFLSIVLVTFLGHTVYAAEQQETLKVQESNALKGQFHLDNVVKIYVPSTYNVDQPIDNTPYVNKSLETFSKMFGGATAIEGTGAWVGDNNQLIKEKVTIVYSFAENLNKKTINEVVAYAKSLKEEMKQSSVSLEVNGKMYFIE